MRRVLIWGGGLLIAVVLVAVGAFLALTPKMRPAPSEKVEATPERLARGAYLFNHVLACVDCHSRHDYTKAGAPLAGPVGADGLCISQKDGFPGYLCAPNVTADRASGVGGWTDGELIRAVREGVDRNGRALFPMMPYAHYRSMSDEDARALVAYLRTVPAVAQATPLRKLNFPLGLLIRLAPQPVTGAVAMPKPADGRAYGEYLTTIAGCAECHTPLERGKPIPGMTFAGGQEMKGPWGRVVTANITPDDETGIGKMTREAFIARFQAMAALPANTPARPGMASVMPWRTYGGMTAEDLGAIYDYLRTVPKVHHTVVAFPDASKG